MKGKYKIFYVATEIQPFAGTSDFAEVAGLFPKALKNIGHDIRVMMPNYRSVNARRYVLRDVIRLKDMPVSAGDFKATVNAKSAFLPDSKVQIYFLDNPEYFARLGLFHDPQTGEEFADNIERMTVFALGCLKTLQTLHWQPNVIHCNGWRTAMLPILIKTQFADDPFFNQPKIVFTPENFSDWGVYDRDVLEKAGLPADIFRNEFLLDDGKKFSFLKAALATSDRVVAPGKHYLHDSGKASEWAAELKKVSDVDDQEQVGIISGIDYQAWDPETDSFLEENYTLRSVGKKTGNKKVLIEALKVPFDVDKPLAVVWLSENAEKELSLLEQSVDELRSLDMQILIVSDSAEGAVLEYAASLANNYSDTFFGVTDPDEETLHKLNAACDFSLIMAEAPIVNQRKFQLVSMRYGTIPIVQSMNGHADAVVEYDDEHETGTGFLFRNADRESFIQALNRAAQVYKDSKKWVRLVKNAMKENFSIETTGAVYTRLYADLLNNSKG